MEQAPDIQPVETMLSYDRMADNVMERCTAFMNVAQRDNLIHEEALKYFSIESEAFGKAVREIKSVLTDRIITKLNKGAPAGRVTAAEVHLADLAQRDRRHQGNWRDRQAGDREQGEL